MKTLLKLAFLLTFALIMTSCKFCGCGNKFYKVTFTDGRVEYYAVDHLDNSTAGFIMLTVKDSTGKEFSRYIPHYLIKNVDQIEGDMPKNSPTVDTTKTKNLPSNIKMK